MSRLRKMNWTRSDVAKLSNAVRSFNKEVESHYDDIDIKALPKLISYREMKDLILTKKDLNLALSTLKKIKNKNAFKVSSSSTNPNVKYIHWTFMTAKRYDYSHRRNMLKELEALKEQRYASSEPEEINGHLVYSGQIKSQRERQLESYLNAPNLRQFQTADSYSRLSNIMSRMTRLAYDSSVIDKAKLYKSNYLKMFEGYENENYYKEIIEKIKKMKPLDFVDWAKRNDEHYDDFAFHYDNGMVQQSFNKLADSLGVDTSSFNAWTNEELNELSPDEFNSRRLVA